MKSAMDSGSTSGPRRDDDARDDAQDNADAGPGAPPDRLRGGRALLVAAAVVVLLALHAGLAVSSMAVKSVTNDELSHLPAGLAAVATGEWVLNPQHPPLVKLLAGLAASGADPTLPLDSPAYREEKEWQFGRAVLFESGNDHRALLFRGRLAPVGLSVLGGLGLFLWGRERFGAPAALVALGLWAFSPTVLAHARLVTMDAAVTAGAVWTLWLGWRTSRAIGRFASAGDEDGGGGGGGDDEGHGDDGGPSPPHLLAATGVLGLALGLTLGAKFSALLLPPALALADLAARGRANLPAGRDRSAWRRLWLARLAVAAGALAVAWGVLQALYFFPADPLRYLHDMAHLYEDRPADAADYLAGRFRRGGFPEYFLVALAVKTTLPGLVAMAAGLFWTGRRLVRRAPGWRDDLFVWVPAGVWIAATSALAEDLGVRYVLPAYPLLFLLAAGAARDGVRALAHRGRLGARLGPVVVGLVLLAQASTTLAAHPDYLPFFHRLAGGERGGVRWLDGSNLDWGQDLERLPAFLAVHGVEPPVRMLYHGAGDPAAYGVDRVPPRPEDWWVAPRPGDYVISAQWLIEGLRTARERGAPTDWLDRHEPAAVLGGSLYLYRFPDSSGAGTPVIDPAVGPAIDPAALDHGEAEGQGDEEQQTGQGSEE